MIVRPATVDDARGVAEVHVASWQAAYAGLIDQATLDALSVDAREAMWARWIFYERHGWLADGAEKTGGAGGVTGLRELRHSRRLPGVRA